VEVAVVVVWDVVDVSVVVEVVAPQLWYS